jgi:DNA mismatch repair ATPase MutS
VDSIILCVTLKGGEKLTLHLPNNLPQLETFFGHPQTQGSDSSVITWTSWIETETRINYALDHQYQLVLDTLKYNLSVISEHPAITEIFKIVSARIAYFDYLGALANKAVHAVTVRKTPICAPSMHSVTTESGKPSIVAQAAYPPYKSRCVAGKEVPNDLYGDQRIQISTGPCSGGKTHTFITTNIMNRVAAGLGDLICAGLFSFDPGGRTLFPVIPGDVKKQGSAFIATIKATKDALGLFAPSKHDQVLFDEFGGGVSGEGGELEVAQDLLTELSNNGLTATYITHNELLAEDFEELGLPSSTLLHAGIVLGPHGPTLTYQQEIGPPDPDLYNLHLRRLIDHHKPGWWIDDDPPPGIE